MEFIVYILAGLLAGILTGLVGLSAAVIIAPIFATFLGMDPYVAIGIALASDVFASGVGAYNYYHNNNLYIEGAIILTSVVVVFTIIASYLSYYTHPIVLNTSINVFVFVLGVRFFVYPVTKTDSNPLLKQGRSIIIQTLIWGAIIGFISGFFGAGGGLSILALLTMLLKYDLKKAVGTSLFVMAFTALVGSVSHIVIGGTIVIPLIVTSIAAVVGSYSSSYLANKINDLLLNRLVGGFLLLDGIALILVHLL